ncbi:MULTISPECIES: TetR/AcrR family transcriptional regulator [unclassified Streptomyces]|uniref:TetR/AcrR family transcriptional regulator n=1 Tax=unclassified Streptomyces TaxID=2593676 RepID=UPI003253B423
MSADERRESAIRAAITEFARGGYNGTSTEVIARRVGVSQPYLFRLFPNKQAMFLAAAERCIADTRQVFADAVEGLEGDEALHAMSEAYQRLIVHDHDRLLMQMQMYAAVAAAEAAGDHEFGESLRAGWLRMFDDIALALGVDTEKATAFLAYGMLINTLTSLGYPADHRVWSGFRDPAAQNT